MNDVPLTHTAFAEQLGVSKGVLSSLRKKNLPPTTDFFTETRPPLYTPAAQKKIRGILAIAEEQPPKKNSAAPGGWGTLIVKRPMPNRRFVECASEATGERIELQVRDNALFTPGLRIEPARYEVGTVRPLYARHKGRPPRSRGRW